MLVISLLWFFFWSCRLTPRAERLDSWKGPGLGRIPGLLERLERRLRDALEARDEKEVAGSLAALWDVIPVFQEYSDMGLLDENAAKRLGELTQRLDALKGDARIKRGVLPQYLNDSYLFGKTPPNTIYATDIPLRALVVSVSEKVNRLHNVIFLLIVTLSVVIISFTIYSLIVRSPKKKPSCLVSETCVCSQVDPTCKIGELKIDEAPDILIKTCCNKKPHLTEYESRLDLCLDDMSDRLYVLEDQAKALYHLCLENECLENDGQHQIDEEAQ